MKIKDVQVHILKKDLSTSMQISRGGFKVRRHCVVQVVTDDGTYGLGEGVGNPEAIQALIKSSIAPMIVGRSPFEIEGIKKHLLGSFVYYERGGSWVCAVAAVETALWDIKGKALGAPLYELLGGKSQSALELYASDVYWYEDPKDVARDIENIYEKSIFNVKLHTGVKGPKEEAARLQQIAKILEPAHKLMIDLNCAYTLPDAIMAVQCFEPFQPFWIEEPLALMSEDQLPRVRAISRSPIAYGENILTPEGFRKVLSQGGVDVMMPDVARVGGILATLDALSVCQAFGAMTSFHNFSSGVLLAATAHIMTARSEACLLEYDSSSNSVLHEFFPEGLQIKGGKLTLSSMPGLGVTLNDAVLRFKE